MNSSTLKKSTFLTENNYLFILQSTIIMLRTVLLAAALASVACARPTLDEARDVNPSQVFNGYMTWYDKEGGLGVKPGACGETNYKDQKIVALNRFQFVELSNSANPNTAEVCHKKIRIKHEGKEVEAEVTDRCDGCRYNDIDGTQAVFNELVGGLGAGNVTVSWSFE
ncbi:putative RlpA-like protein double-psi beta-barrel domain-containing protein [Seiridium cardinale]|uniref:RlpA-like protein double-psi beta-barrel domain-containing protein n=1 Tax=Seiridium cardinale TaxID=138064 RepID=A0ABR2Y309_9PEZI